MPIHDNKGRNPVPELGDASSFYQDGKPPEPTQAEIDAFKAAMAEEISTKVNAAEKEGNEARKRVVREMAKKLNRVEFYHDFEIKDKKVDGVRGGEPVLAINLDAPILPVSVTAIGETEAVIETRNKFTPIEDPGLDGHVPNPENILVIEVESANPDPLQVNVVKGAGPAKPGIAIPESDLLVVPVAFKEGPQPHVHVTVSQETRGGDFDLSRQGDSRKGIPEEPVIEGLPIHNAEHSVFVPANSKIKPFFRKSESDRIPEGNPYAFPPAPVSRAVDLPEGTPAVAAKVSVFTDPVGGKPVVRLAESAPLELPVSQEGKAFFAAFEPKSAAKIPEVIPGIAIQPEAAIPMPEGISVPENPVVQLHVAALIQTENLPERKDLPLPAIVEGQPLPESRVVTVDPVLPAQEPIVRIVEHATDPNLNPVVLIEERAVIPGTPDKMPEVLGLADSPVALAVVPDRIALPEGGDAVVRIAVPELERPEEIRIESPETLEKPADNHGDRPIERAVTPGAEDVELPETHIHLKPIEHEDKPLIDAPAGVALPVELRDVQVDDPALLVDPSAIVPDSVHQNLVFGEIKAPGFPEFVVSEAPDHRPADRLVLRTEGGSESRGADHYEQPPLLRESEDADFRIDKADLKRAGEIEDDKIEVPDSVMQAGALYRLHAGESPLQAAFNYQPPVQQGNSTPLTQEVVSMVDRLLVTADGGSYVKEVRMTMNDSVLPNTEIQFRQVGNSLTVTLFNEDGASLELLRKEAPELAEALRARTGDEVEVKIVTGVGLGASEETV
jgi:hypothetical protein